MRELDASANAKVAFELAKREQDVEMAKSRASEKEHEAHRASALGNLERVRAEAGTRGYVETIFGRRLYLPDIRSRNPSVRQAAERTAINAPMQGSAADIIKRAMIHLDAWLQESDAPARMVMQVHDELVLEVREDALEEVGAKVRALMSGAARLQAELVVDVGTGMNWDEAH